MSQPSLIPTETPAEPLPLREETVPVRWGRVLAIALPLVILNGGWIANSEMKTGVTELTISTLFIGVTFILFVVTLLNLLVRKISGRRAALNQPEMMGLYMALSLSSVIAGVGHFGFLTPFLANPFYYDTPQNGWDGFRDSLPWYIGPRSPAILHGFYVGHATPFTRPILTAWAGPLAVWCGFFLVLLWTTLCLATILRQRWADEEHLPFPVLALPLEMTREGVPLYGKRLLWLGFAIPCVLHSINSLNSLYPTVPSLPMNSWHDLIPVAGLTFPWTGMDSFFYLLHPAGIGFGYLINTDVSFSLWFFYLLKKMLGVWGAAEGWRQPMQGWGGDATSQFPFTGFQGYGAWLALSITALWTGRGYYRDYVHRAWFGDRTGIDRGELLSARTAILGFLGGFLVLCVFVWSTGGSWWLPIAFLALYMLIMVALTRLRAETAVLSTELSWISPQAMLPSVLGTSGMERMDLVHMGMLSWFNLDYRAAGMPHELEGMVGLKRAGGTLRPLLGVLLIVALVGMVSALLWDLQLYYANGAATGNVNAWRVTSRGNVAWDTLAQWLRSPQPPDPHALAGAAVGIGITVLLTALRTRFVGFPLHPAAYVLNTSFANDFFWCDMFVAWLLKSLVLRYGGMNIYRQALPFFLGLILGDFVTGAAWSIAGTALHVSLFRTFAI